MTAFRDTSSSSPRRGLARILVVGGAMAVGVVLLRTALGPVLGAGVSMLMAGLYAYLRYRKPIATGWLSLGLIPVAFAASYAVARSVLMVRSVEVIEAALACAGLILGLILGWRCRGKITHGRRFVHGLGLPLIGWQWTATAAYGAALFGYVMIAQLGLLVLAGATTATIAATILGALRAHRAQPSTSGSPASMTGAAAVGPLLLLFALLLGVPAAQAQIQQAVRSGVWAGRIDSASLAELRSLHTVEGTGECQITIRGDEVSLRVHSDGTAELVRPVRVQVVWTMGHPNSGEGCQRETYNATYRPAGKRRLAQFVLDLEYDEETYSEPSARMRQVLPSSRTRTTRQRHRFPDENIQVTVEPNGDLLMRLDGGYSGPGARLIRWRLEYGGGTTLGLTSQSLKDGMQTVLGDILTNRDPSDSTVQAGLLTGLLLLLAGISADTAGAIASAAAAPSSSGGAPPPPPAGPPPGSIPTLTPGTHALTGDDAWNWLVDRHYIHPDGTFTRHYHQFNDALYSDRNDSNLFGIFYGDTDPNAYPTGPIEQDTRLDKHEHLTIVVRNEPKPPPPPPPPSPPSPVKPPLPPEPQPPEPAPPEESHEPKPEPPVRKGPCDNLIHQADQTQQTGEKLVAESRRLHEQIKQLQLEIEARRIVGVTGLFVDTLSTGLTIYFSTLKGALSSVPVSVIQGVVSETVKSCVRDCYLKDPDHFWWNVTRTEFFTALGAALGEALKRSTIRYGAGTGAENAIAAAAQLTKNVVMAAVQSAATMFYAGKDATEFNLWAERQVERIKTLRRLRREMQPLITEQRKRKTDGLDALVDCLKRNRLPLRPWADRL